MVSRVFRSGVLNESLLAGTFEGNLFTGRSGPDRRDWIIRPDDLLVLDFDLVNLQVQKLDGKDLASLVKQGPGPAYLIVTFPPQHLVERAFFTTVPDYPIENPKDPDHPDGDNPPQDQDPLPPPIEARLSGWSRLVFRVSDDDLPIDWTLETLLEAMKRLKLSVPSNALPRSNPIAWVEDLPDHIVATAGIMPVELGANVSEAPLLPPELAGLNSAIGGSLISVSRARRHLRTHVVRLGLGSLSGTETTYTPDPSATAVAIGFLPSFLLRPQPQPPTPNQTALELPYRLLLSPNKYGAWFHSPKAATSDKTEHTELWHTRLGSWVSDTNRVEGRHWRRTLRAVWTLDKDKPDLKTPAFGANVEVPDHNNKPFRMSLDSFDRHNIVHLSSNFRLQDPTYEDELFEPSPLDVNLLALTSQGAWLDSRGVWDEQPLGLSVEEWRHRATLGRDHFVRVVYAGFLFPWGHRASLVKITERRFQEEKPGNPAYLRQRMFILVREPIKAFRNTQQLFGKKLTTKDGESFDRMIPFQSVRFTTLVSPLLDKPENSHIAEKLQGCFWPYVGGKPFKFHLIGTDTTGNEVELMMPLIFVGKEETDEKFQDEPGVPLKDQAFIIDDVADKYNKSGLNIIPLQGQFMAFAESKTPDDTAFNVQSLTFGAVYPEKATYNSLTPQKPRFFPVVLSARIDVPALQAIARTTESSRIAFSPTYLKEGFGGSNLGEVFLEAESSFSTLKVPFSSQGDRSGALVTPDMEVSGLSRIVGPVSGEISTAIQGRFDPLDWFSNMLSGAKLFGAISLTEILKEVGFDAQDMLPQFVGQSLNQVERVIAELERLRELIKESPSSIPNGANADFVLDQLLDPTNGSIPALLKGGTVGPVATQLGTLAGELGVMEGALAGSDLAAGPKARLQAAVKTLTGGINDLLDKVEMLQSFANGDLLPESLQARFEWRPLIQPVSVFEPDPALNYRNLLLAVQAAGDDFSVVCSLDRFKLVLAFIELDFERVQFRVEGGKKPDVDVQFKEFTFIGPLSFVQTLRDVIPFDGFSDPPEIDVTAEGITAGFSTSLPNIAVGVFSLENLALAAGFNVPFLGPSLSTWFRFCERENPARLTVSMFGGGFFFGLTVNPKELVVLEGAIEFGAAISVNFGVASGSVSAMAGLYFKLEVNDATLAGYFRLRGEVDALGIVSVSLELYLELRYETGSGKCVGTATISLEISIAFFSTTIEITCTKKFAGSNGDPTFAELMDVAPDATSVEWTKYCKAFA